METRVVKRWTYAYIALLWGKRWTCATVKKDLDILSSINLHRNRGDSTPLWNLHVEPEQECLSNAVCQTVQTLSKVLNQTDAVKQIQTLLLIF